MKKWTKGFIATLTSVTLGFNTPYVQAQETTFQEIYQELREAANYRQSHAGNWQFDGTMFEPEMGETFDVSFDLDYVLNEDFESGQATFNVNLGPGLGVPMNMSIEYEASMVDGFLFYYDGYEWLAEDISEDLEDLLAPTSGPEDIHEWLRDQGLDQSTIEEIDREIVGFFNEVFIVEEDETTYQITLNKEADVQTYVEGRDLDGLITRILDQVESDATQEEIDEFDNAAWAHLMDNFINQMEAMSIILDKDNLQVVSWHLKGDYSLEAMLEGIEPVTPEENLAFQLDITVNNSRFGEVFEVEVPEEYRLINQVEESSEDESPAGDESGILDKQRNQNQ